MVYVLKRIGVTPEASGSGMDYLLSYLTAYSCCHLRTTVRHKGSHMREQNREAGHRNIISFTESFIHKY